MGRCIEGGGGCGSHSVDLAFLVRSRVVELRYIFYVAERDTRGGFLRTTNRSYVHFADIFITFQSAAAHVAVNSSLRPAKLPTIVLTGPYTLRSTRAGG